MTSSTVSESAARRGDSLTTSVDQAADDVRAMWREHIRRALGQPYLLMLMIGSLLLSAASFFTTFMGMLHFMPVIFVTFCIVFAIQALLFVTSWRIGFALADREDTPWFTVFVFLICLATSVFFSWVALFESINDDETQARTRETRIHRAVEDTVTELQTRVQFFRRDRVEELLDSPAFADWTGMIDQVAAEAVTARAAIESARDAAATSVAERIATLEDQRAVILREDAVGAERKSSAQRNLERLEADRGPLLERVNRLRGEYDQAEQAVVVQEGRMEAEETGGGDGRPAGRGPVWRTLRDERNILAAERDAKQRLFENARAELSETDARMEQLRADIAAAGVTAGAAELAVIERRLAELQEEGRAGVAGDPNALERDVEQMRNDLAAFATRFELEPFDAAAARCTELLETMRANPTLRSRVAGLSCDRNAMAALVNPIRIANENQQSLAQACQPGGATTRRISELGFEESVSYGRECIDRAGLPSTQVADLRGEIARLVLEEDPDASQFVKTVNAFNGGDKLNYLALSIALFIDMLVLFSGLIGALSASDSIARHFGRTFTRTESDNFIRALDFRIQDDERLPVAKTLLQHVRPYIPPTPTGWWARRRMDDSLIARIDTLDVVHEEDRLILQQFLLEQYAQGHAVIDEDQSKPEHGRYVFLLRKPVIDAVRDLYLRKAEDMERSELVAQQMRKRREEKAQKRAEKRAAQERERERRRLRLEQDKQSRREEAAERQRQIEDKRAGAPARAAAAVDAAEAADADYEDAPAGAAQRASGRWRAMLGAGAASLGGGLRDLGDRVRGGGRGDDANGRRAEPELEDRYADADDEAYADDVYEDEYEDSYEDAEPAPSNRWATRERRDSFFNAIRRPAEDDAYADDAYGEGRERERDVRGRGQRSA